jgi:WD40 repeat protein
MWDAATGQPIGRPADVPNGWPALALARDGRKEVIVVTVAESSVWDREGPRVGYARTALLDPKTGKLIGRPRQIHDGGVHSAMAMTYEPARDLVLCAGQADDLTFRIWDARTGRAIGPPPSAPGAPRAFTRIAGRLILVSSYGSETRFRDVFTGEEVRHPVTHDYTPQVLTVGRVGDRDVIVCGCQDYLEVIDWDAEDHPFGHTDSVVSLARGTVGHRDVILSAAACDDDTVLAWDASTGQPVGPGLKPHHVSIDALAAGRAGDREVVITADQNSSPTAGQIRVWDLMSGVPIGDPIPGGDVTALAMGRVGDRDLIVSAASDGVVTWDAVTREAVHRLSFIKPDHPRALALSLVPNGPDLTVLCAAALDSEVIVHAWHAATGQLANATGIRVIVSRPTLAFAWLMYRLCIVFVDERDQNLHIRDASDGYGSVIGPAFAHPASKIYALAGGHVAGRDVVVTGGSDGTVTIWNPETGEPFGEPLAGHEGPVLAVTLNGDYIVSGGTDRRVICWTALPPPRHDG